MGYLEKNIDCIKENRPDLYEKYIELHPEEKLEDEE